MSNKFSQEKDFRVCAARLSTIPMKKLIPRNCVTWLPLQKLCDMVATSTRVVSAVVPLACPISWYGCCGCDASRLRAHSSPVPDASPCSADAPPRRRIACKTASHLLRLDFLIFLLKKQQHLVSSTTSTSALPRAMGALERSAVAPSSSRDRSMLVEPRTTCKNSLKLIYSFALKVLRYLWCKDS